MASVVYAGLANGGRILRWTDELTQVTDLGTEDVLMAIETQDQYPAGTAGDCVLREVAVTVRCDNGMTGTVTPLVDGVAQTAQDITILGPVTQTVQVWPTNDDTIRGARFAARVQQTAPSTGAVELLDVSMTFVVIRESP